MDEDYSGKVVDGRYRLDDMLGEGGMGAVYSGFQLAVDRRVAVKLLHPFLQRDQNFKARFELEAKALARLSHTNCITLFDFGYCDELEVFYMVLEYVEGNVLSDWMVDTISYPDTLEISYRISLALEHAHGQGILHRDLKPENIMVSRDGASIRVKVLDFGLARLLMSEEEEEEEESMDTTQRKKRLTRAGEIYGTPAYMSPEQCRGSRDLSQSSDLYALGVMMYEMIEGRLPFFADSPPEIMVKHLSEAPPDVVSAPDADIKMLVEWMLRKEPEQRPASAEQVLEVLRRFAGNDGSKEFGRPESGAFSGAFPSDSSGPYPGQTGSPGVDDSQESGRKIPVVPVVAAVVGFLFLVVIAVALNTSDEPDAVEVDTAPESAASVEKPVKVGDEIAGKGVDQNEVDGAESDESNESVEMTFGEFEVDAASADAGAVDQDAGVSEDPPTVEPAKKKKSRKRRSRRSKPEKERPRKLKLTY